VTVFPLPSAAAPPSSRAVSRRRLLGLIAALVVLAALFGRPLLQLLRFSLSDDLFSYIPLIPLAAGYLIWRKRASLALDAPPAPVSAALSFLAGGAILAALPGAVRSGWLGAEEDYLAATTISFLLFFLGILFLFLGSKSVRAIAFPIAFLVFAIPMPSAWKDGFAYFLQYCSACVAFAMFRLSGMPALQHDIIIIDLPGFSLEVAPECSGIHSTLVLLITSALAGYLYFRSSWRRAILVAAVVPLALLRNGFRVWVIGQLCVRIGPWMINSYIHRHGGPIFFVLSLVPLFLLIAWLQKGESPPPAASRP
jgi:exosortase C (VPDSG-CTERM-specific)